MKKQTIKARSHKYLFDPNKPGLGITYSDDRFNDLYAIGICSTSRGRCLTTWGLNAKREDLKPGIDYVFTGYVWDPDKRENFEAILEVLR